MIIRCPHCEHVRSVIESNIPATAEYAKCPKCGHRFRFRTVETALPTEEAAPQRPERPEPAAPSMNPNAPPSATDIWDAVESLHQKWNNQMDQQVTEVVTPQPLRPRAGDSDAHEQAMSSPQHRNDARQQAAPSPRTGESDAHEQNAPSPRPAEAGQPLAAPADIPDHAKHLPLFSLPDAPPAHAEHALPQEHQAGPHTHAGPWEHEAQPRLSGADADTPAVLRLEGGDAPARQQEPRPVPPIFSYAASDLSPEEKVEQDMRLLLAEGDRPSRDLGNIDDHIAMLDAGNEEESAPDPTPWENPKEHGWLQAFTRTIHGAMFSAPEFFSRLSPSGPLAPGYLFFLILGYVAILCAALWRHALGNILAAAQPAGPLALPVLLLLAPVALGLALLLLTGCLRVILHLFAPEKALFPLLFKLISYSVAPLILSIIPFVGPPVGLLWFLTVFTIGCRHRLDASWPLVLLGMLPPVVIVIGLLAFSLL